MNIVLFSKTRHPYNTFMWTLEFPSWHGSNLKPKAPNASSETEEPQPGVPNPSPERVEQHPKTLAPLPGRKLTQTLGCKKICQTISFEKETNKYNAVIEALTNENRKLTSKSKVAHAKLEIIFEKGTQAFSEVMAKTKDDSAQDRKSASKDKRKKLSWWFKQ
ncbi:hypothetical protein ACFX2A_031822 [Malus domestica]